MHIWLDLETYNEKLDIKKAGTYEYARTCEIMLFAYAIDDGPVKLWDRTQETMPPELYEVMRSPNITYTAHNAMFDRTVLRLSGLFEDHIGDPKNWSCTMVQAYLHGFIGSLDKLGEIFGLGDDEAKIKDGKKLINRFCKPAPKNHKADRYTSETHPEEWERFCDYAKRDITAMRKVADFLPSWNQDISEYHLDQKINDRGFQVDLELVDAGAKVAAREKEELFSRFILLTNGEVEKPTQRAKFKDFLNKQFDLKLENTQRATLEPLLSKEEIDEKAKELIEISLMANKTSTAKYATLYPAVSPDRRFRGGLQFSGASRTRRWAGRTFQPQNLPSRGLPPTQSTNLYIEALKSDIQDVLFHGELMLYGSAALRGVLVTPVNKKLCVSDLANIEGRANAWLAGEDWKLKAFRAYDQGKGPDLYKVAASKILGKSPEAVSSVERNSFGKVTELALGYQGGVGAIQKFGNDMNVAFSDHWEAIQQSVDPSVIDKANDNWEKWGRERAEDTPEDEWIASEVVKLSWRASHPAISKLWYTCEDAALSAMRTPGQVFKAGQHLAFRYVRYKGFNYLLLRLPSGKFLVYFNPRVDTGDVSLKELVSILKRLPKDKAKEIIRKYGATKVSEIAKNKYKTIYHTCLNILGERPKKPKITYSGIDSEKKNWARQNIYGGKFVENACQSLSRDILMQGIFKAESSGYKPVLTVHDELVTECPDSDAFTHEELSKILATPLNWCPGFPLAAEGFEAYRYRK